MSRFLAGLICVIVWLALPAVISTDSTLSLFIFAFINLILAIGLSLLFGYAGQISLGQAGFYGIGAYVSSWLAIHAGVPTLLGLVAATLVPAALAYLIGRPVFRLRGYYLAMVTAAMGIILHTVFVEWESVTGGYSGIAGIPPLSIGPVAAKSPLAVYYVTEAIALVVLILSQRLVNTAYGRAMRTTRESESAARASGISISALKAEVFALSAGLSGLGGALYAHYVGFISPESFTIDTSVNLLLALVIGGVGSLWGAALGAILLTFMPEWFNQLQNAYGLVLGGLVVILLTLEPHGIIGVATRLYAQFSKLHVKRLREI